MMRCIDTAVESVMSAVSSGGFLDNTLVIFAGDNGGAPKNGGYNWPLRGSKGTLYEGGIRQAAWAWGAMLDSSVRGTTYHGQIHLADMFPTFMSVATGGHWTPDHLTGESLDGVDVFEAIAFGVESPRTETLLNCVDSAGGIRVGNWKLLVGQKEDSWYAHPDASTNANDYSSMYIKSEFASPVRSAVNQTVNGAKDNNNGGNSVQYQLFNVADDEYEYTNLYESYPDIVTELAAKLQVYCDEAVDYNYHSDKYDAAKTQAASTGYWGPFLSTLDQATSKNGIAQE
jgi:arylsulfatase A-like enzyme